MKWRHFDGLLLRELKSESPVRKKELSEKISAAHNQLLSVESRKSVKTDIQTEMPSGNHDGITSANKNLSANIKPYISEHRESAIQINISKTWELPPPVVVDIQTRDSSSPVSEDTGLLDRLVYGSCALVPRVICGFLQIPPRDGYPCRPANRSSCQVGKSSLSQVNASCRVRIQQKPPGLDPGGFYFGAMEYGYPFSVTGLQRLSAQVATRPQFPQMNSGFLTSCLNSSSSA